MADFIALDDMKMHLRVDDDSEDALIAQLTLAAVKRIERETGYVCAAERTETFRFDAFDDQLRLPLRPVKADSVAISYLDTSGSAQTFADFRLVEMDKITRLVPAVGATWPAPAQTAGAVTVTATVGYPGADLATAPDDDLRAAAKLIVGHWFANRETVVTGTIATELPLTAAALLDLCAERRT